MSWYRNWNWVSTSLVRMAGVIIYITFMAIPSARTGEGCIDNGTVDSFIYATVLTISVRTMEVKLHVEGKLNSIRKSVTMMRCTVYFPVASAAKMLPNSRCQLHLGVVG